MSQSVSVSLAA